MRERLNQIEEQIRRSQQTFGNDITISNISGKNITLTLNIEDKEYNNDNINLQSRINLPNNTIVSHRVSQQSSYFGEDYQRNQFSQKKRNELLSSAKRTKVMDEEAGYYSNRAEQKMQPASASLTDRPGRISKEKKSVQLQETYKPSKRNKQIVIQDEEYQSDIEEQSDIKPFVESKYKNQAISDRKQKDTPMKQSNKEKVISQFQTNTLDSQNFSSKIENPISSKDQYPQQSPQVLSYLHQDYRKHQPQINTPFDKRFSRISPLKNQKEVSYNNQTDLRISAQLSQIFRSSHGHATPGKSYNTNKVLSDSIMSDSMRKTKLQSKKAQVDMRKKTEISSSNKRPNKSPSQPIKPVHKADALFMQRKIKFLNNSHAKDNSKYFLDKQKRVNRFANTKSQQQVGQSLSKRSLSPKVEQITDRLYYSRKQSPCTHNRRFNQSQERERFHFLVNQNQFVAKYMSSAEKQQLFQRLRSQQESVSLWPMKIVNYTYSKLRISYSEAYSSIIT